MKYAWRPLSSVTKKMLKNGAAARLGTNDALFVPRQIPAFLDSNECDRALALCNPYDFSSGQVGSIGINTLRDSQITWLYPSPETEWLFHKLDQLVIWANQAYQFTLSGFLQGAQIAIYGNGGHYGWHIDGGRGNTSTRKLGISIQLSDESEYDGGEVEFMGVDGSALKQRGTAIVFPSFLYHRVCPVTRGRRVSLVSWVSGTPFR